MNIQFTVKELYQSLDSIIGAVEKKLTLPILSHVLIQTKNNQLTLTTTDMEIGLSTINHIKSKEEVSFTVNAKNLIDIIKKLPEKTLIEFIIEHPKVFIKTNNDLFELNSFNHQDFPTLPAIDNNEIITIKCIDLKNLIEKTSFSMGNQDIRAYLNGLYFELNKDSIIVVATDGHRLSTGKIKQKNKLSNKKTIILPKVAVSELAKLLKNTKQNSINIQLSDNYFYVITDSISIVSRLIDGNFPNYKQVIPDNHENIIIINRQDFLNGLQQASIFIEERTKGVKLIFKDKKLNILSHSEKGQAKIQIDTKNFDQEIEIGFNIHYLISILEKITTNEINMIIPEGENQSCLLNAIDDDIYQYVVMPMKI